MSYKLSSVKTKNNTHQGCTKQNGAGLCIAPMNASGGATPGRSRSNDLAGRSTALAPPCL